jgi:hypothetical protein
MYDELNLQQAVGELQQLVATLTNFIPASYFLNRN